MNHQWKKCAFFLVHITYLYHNARFKKRKPKACTYINRHGWFQFLGSYPSTSYNKFKTSRTLQPIDKSSSKYLEMRTLIFWDMKMCRWASSYPTIWSSLSCTQGPEIRAFFTVLTLNTSRWGKPFLRDVGNHHVKGFKVLQELHCSQSLTSGNEGETFLRNVINHYVQGFKVL
jgi:hypothetical protein